MLRLTTPIFFIALTIAMSVSANADTKAAIQQRLEAQYALTKTTYDQTNMVSAGARIVLEKSGLIMVPVSSMANPYQNTYEHGQITQNAFSKAKQAAGVLCGLFGGRCPTPAPAPAASALQTRTFAAGEAMWVTNIIVTDRNVVFDLWTDPYPAVRYKASLTIPYSGQPDPLVAEVFAVQPVQTAAAPSPAPSQGYPAPLATQPPSAPQPEYLPIVPPPPPQPDLDDPVPAMGRPTLRRTGDEPATGNDASIPVSVGDTVEQVEAALGQPATIGQLSSNRAIYFYPGIKVTFENGRVVEIH